MSSSFFLASAKSEGVTMIHRYTLSFFLKDFEPRNSDKK